MRSPFLRSLFWVLLLSTCATTFAQQDKKQTRVLLYKDRIAAQWDTVKCIKNVFKINPLLFFRGEIPLYYERALSSRLSAELGIGFTYRNYLNLSFAGDDADDFGAGTLIRANPSYHLAARYYFKDGLEPEGAYIQTEFAYLDYAKDIRMKDSTGQLTDNTLRDDRIFNDLRLLFGYQGLSGNSNWLFDVYGGLGIRSRAMKIVHEDLNLAEGQWNYKVEEKNDVVPAIFLGVRVGYGF